MKNNLKAAVIALTALTLIFAASSCGDDVEQTQSDVCALAKYVKDSTIKAGSDINANVNM